MKATNKIKTYLNEHHAHFDASLYEALDNAHNVLDDDVRRFNDEVKRFTQTRRRQARSFKQLMRAL